MNRARAPRGKVPKTKGKRKEKASRQSKKIPDAAEPSIPVDNTAYPDSEDSASNNDKLQKLVASAFHNHVFVEHLMPYLDFASIKALSAVNKQLKWIVRGNKEFIDRCRIVFFKSEALGPKPDFFKPSDFPWKTVAVELHSGWKKKKEVTSICRLIPNITALEVHSGGPGVDLATADIMATLLRTSAKLRDLTVDAEILDLIPSESFDLAMKKAEETLKQLDSLYITNPISGKYGVLGAASFAANVKLLGESPNTLSRFGFERISFMEYDFHTDAQTEKKAVTESLISVLQKHHQSLTKLSMDSSIWDADSFSSLVFPRLTDLSLVGNSNEFTKLVMFLSKQPPLQSLTLKLEGVTNGGQDLGPPLLKHGPHLKTFNFTWKPATVQIQPLHPVVVRDDAADEEDWDNNGEVRQIQFQIRLGVVPDDEVDGPQPQGPNNNAPLPLPRRIDFSFLKNFGALQKIVLRQCSTLTLSHFALYSTEAHGRDPRISLGTILSLLPDGIREIDICGMRPEHGDSAQTTIESLSRFRNLTVLNLVQCPEVINDEVLVYICSHMKSLLELGFSHCAQVTDEALTGKRHGAVVAPGLNTLFGLRKLEIIDCVNLTRKAFLSSLVFPDLRDLTLVTAAGFLNQAFYETILKQNKSLEILAISDAEEMGFQKLEKVLKRRSGRFRTLLFIPPVSDTVDASSEEGDFFGEDDFFSDDMYPDSDLDSFGFDGYSDDDDVDPDWGFGDY